MKVDVPPCLLPCLQDSPRLVCVEYPLLTKHINVVNAQLSRATQLLERWYLNVYDVMSGILRCTASENV